MFAKLHQVKAKWKGFALFLPPILLFICLTYISRMSLQMTSEEFYGHYIETCEKKTSKQRIGKNPWCPCLPNGLVGEYDVSNFISENYYTSLEIVPKENNDITLAKPSPVTIGGHWKPRKCRARQTVAIIIPFRNRYPHLAVFEKYIHMFLQRQQLDYSIFVIEQASPEIFNRAALMNVGYLEALRRRPGGYDCYIFHDVDLLPENDHNMYTCFFSPLHLGAYMNKFNYRLPYSTFFGGAIAMDGRTINATNGFPTQYYGWGGEDDDIWNRIKWQNLSIVRYPSLIGKSYMVFHDEDDDNPINPNKDIGLQMSSTSYKQNGLSSIKYRTLKEKVNPLHTIITISLEKEYQSECIINLSLPATSPGNYMDCMTKEMFLEGTIDCCRNQAIQYCCTKTLLKPVTKRRVIIVFILPITAITAAFVIYRGIPLVKRKFIL